MFASCCLAFEWVVDVGVVMVVVMIVVFVVMVVVVVVVADHCSSRVRCQPPELA